MERFSRRSSDRHLEDWFLTDGKPVGSVPREELSAIENRAIPTIGRLSDAVEAVADERQDPITSLNFPLHWSSAAESWNYLFDFSVACELLGPRPEDRILDFAAGTGWASEFLTRLGVRTVSVDLSIEMMRRSRSRLAADARLQFRDQASFVAARGQQLPFLDESFDAVLCMNALHHLPSFGDALKEIHRILKQGGRAVFSEPGADHALQPLSQFRMREENILEKSVSLALIHRLAEEAGFRRMRVVPLRRPAAYAIDYTATLADASQLQHVWEETCRYYPREHARFVLCKGDDPAADTLLPAPQLIGRLQAQIVLMSGPPTVPAGAGFTDRLRITNTGSVTWKAIGPRFGGQVNCGLKVCTEQDDVIREDLGRTTLSRDIGPGEECEIDVVVPAGLPSGRYLLRYDMVVEGITWFEFYGSPCLRRTLTVSPD